jgi:hypothetical protein
MNRISFLLAAAALTANFTGCCCCRNWFAQPQPVAACAPACPPPAPACPPPCDPCTTAPVTYGAAPVAPYTPPQW